MEESGKEAEPEPSAPEPCNLELGLHMSDPAPEHTGAAVPAVTSSAAASAAYRA